MKSSSKIMDFYRDFVKLEATNDAFPKVEIDMQNQQIKFLDE